MGRILEMASVSFSCEQSVARKLDLYRKKHKLGSRTKAINNLLAKVNSFKGNGLDANGEPI